MKQGLTTKHNWDTSTLSVVKDYSESKPVRFDTKVTRRARGFLQFGKQGQLMFHVMYYMSMDHQYNFDLFSGTSDKFIGGQFDVDHFCTEMKYSKRWLWELMPDEESAWLRRYPRRTGNKDMFYRRKIGDALFRLYTENMDVRIDEDDPNFDTSAISASVGMLVALSIKAQNDYTRKTVINYAADPAFFEHMEDAFTLMHTSRLIALRKPNCDIAYAVLKDERNFASFKGQITYDMDFDLAVDLFMIECKEPKNAKTKVAAKLGKLALEQDLNFDFEFYNKSGKWDYGITLTFKDLSLEEEEINKLAVKDAFNHKFYRSLKGFYQDRYPDHCNMRSFSTWLNNPSVDPQIKKQMFVEIYHAVYKKKLHTSHSIVIDRLAKIDKDHLWNEDKESVQLIKRTTSAIG